MNRQDAKNAKETIQRKKKANDRPMKNSGLAERAIRIVLDLNKQLGGLGVLAVPKTRMSGFYCMEESIVQSLLRNGIIHYLLTSASVSTWWVWGKKS